MKSQFFVVILNRNFTKGKITLDIDLLYFEKQFLEKGMRYICGVDEVGRGPLAGPVTCCAVVMDLENIIEGVNDSKKLSEQERNRLYPYILDRAVSVGLASYNNEIIDEINILNATKKCMQEAVLKLEVKPDVVLIDALKIDLPYLVYPIIHGDALSYSIAAASIVAKVSRDAYMTEIGKSYPEYLFEKNKGYGTAEHIKALKQFGATPYHRKSFIKNFINELVNN